MRDRLAGAVGGHQDIVKITYVSGQWLGDLVGGMAFARDRLDRRGRVGYLVRKVSRRQVYADPDDHGEAQRRFDRFGQYAADLAAVDEEIVHPFNVSLDAKLDQGVTDRDAGHQCYQRY